MDKTKKYSHHEKKPYSRGDDDNRRGGRDSRDNYQSRDRNRDRDRDNDRERDRGNRGGRGGGGGRGGRGNFRKPRDEGNYDKMEYGLQNKEKKEKDEEEQVPKEQPSLALSGNLAKDTNTFNGVVIKYNEPSEARKPKKRWRLYVFKGEEELPFYQIHRQSAYLFGRERKIADIPVDHPSCSKQHAVFQYRLVGYKKEDGSNGRTIKPYIIDLGSTNGTYINNERIEAQRYYELREKDVIKFGFSSREYVLLHEGSHAEDGESDAETSSGSDNDDDEGVLKKLAKKGPKGDDDSDKEDETLKEGYQHDDSD